MLRHLKGKGRKTIGDPAIGFIGHPIECRKCQEPCDESLCCADSEGGMWCIACILEWAWEACFATVLKNEGESY